MDCTFNKAFIKPLLYIVATASVLGALLLPWIGFNFLIFGQPVHFHSLKNFSGFLLILLGSWALIPSQRVPVTAWMERIDHWADQHPEAAPWLIAGVSSLLLVNVKLFQHFSLQTHAYELGIFANICWNTLHGQFLYDSVKGGSYLGDHFQPILALLAPALWLWNNAAVLLVIQSIGIGLAVPPLFWLTQKISRSGSLAVGLCLLYLSGPFLNAMSVFDFHPEVLAIPLFLWGLWFLETGRPRIFLATCLLALSLKEDVPIALTALGAVLVFQKPENKKIGLTLVILSAAAFVAETQIIIPHYLQNGPSVHFDRYSHLGESYEMILVNTIFDPRRIARGIFLPVGKWLNVLKYLISFGFLPLFSFGRFLPALASLFPHLSSRYAGQYSLSGQYTALSYPFSLWASASSLKRFSKKKTFLLAGFLILSGMALVTNSRYGHPPDWKRVGSFFELIKEIPPEATVRAQSDLLPHVCLRRTARIFAPYKFYRFLPLFEETREKTDYVLLDIQGNTWPMNRPLFESRHSCLESKGRYRLLKSVQGFELWQRVTP